MNNPRTPEQKALERAAAKERRKKQARPMHGLGFFVARQTRVVYHPIASAQDWDYDCKNRQYDPDRGREILSPEKNDAVLREWGKEREKRERKEAQGRGSRVYR